MTRGGPSALAAASRAISVSRETPRDEMEASGASLASPRRRAAVVQAKRAALAWIQRDGGGERRGGRPTGAGAAASRTRREDAS